MLVQSVKKAKNTLNQVGATVQRPTSFLPFLLLIIAAIFFLPSIIRKWVKRAQNKSDIDNINNSSVPSGINNNSSYNPTINTAVTARSLYDAIWNNDWLGMSESEEEIIDILKTIPDNQMPQVALEYSKLTVKNSSWLHSKDGTLYDHVLKFCDVSDLKEAGVYNKINR